MNAKRSVLVVVTAVVLIGASWIVHGASNRQAVELAGADVLASQDLGGGIAGGSKRIPIDGPRIIDAPGHYYLVKDIVAHEDGLRITASDVEIDLSGFTIRKTPPPSHVGISIGADRVAIHSGRIDGGFFTGIAIGNVTDYRIEDLEVRGNWMNGSFAGRRGDISSNRFVQPGVFSNVHVTGTDIRIEKNRFVDGADTGQTTIDCDSCVIRDNSFMEGPSIRAHTGLAISGSGNRIDGNRISDMCTVYTCIPFVVSGSGNWITGNQVSRNGVKSLLNTPAVLVDGSANRIESNLITENAQIGLMIRGDNNVILGNVSRGNGGGPCAGPGGTADFCDEGEGNTLGGTNFMPDNM